MSPNGAYRLDMQGDHHLVLYRNSENQPLWASRTVGTGATNAVMQHDGNLVLLKANGDPVSATRTDGWRADR